MQVNLRSGSSADIRRHKSDGTIGRDRRLCAGKKLQEGGLAQQTQFNNYYKLVEDEKARQHDSCIKDWPLMTELVLLN